MGYGSGAFCSMCMRRKRVGLNFAHSHTHKVPMMTVMKDVAILKSEFREDEAAVTKIQHFQVRIYSGKKFKCLRLRMYRF